MRRPVAGLRLESLAVQCCPYVDKGQLHTGRTSYLQLEMA